MNAFAMSSPNKKPARQADHAIHEDGNSVAIDEELLYRQSVIDIATRTQKGPPLYLAIWLVLSFCSGLYRERPAFVAAHAVAFALIGLGRLVVQRRLAALVHWNSRLANLLFSSMVVGTGLYWGCLMAASLLSPWGETVCWGMLVAGAAFAAAGSSIMSIHPTLCFLYPLGFVLPVLYCAVVHPDPRDILIGSLSPFFLLYVVAVGRTLKDDYWGAAKARQIAEAKANSLAVLSATDALTGIANRLAFDARLHAEWERAERSGDSLSLLMVDLDKFKSLNDTYGHGFGDQCLKAAARALASSMRGEIDFVSRFGGEEFVVLLPHTSLEAAMGVANRCLNSVRAIRMRQDASDVPVTCSIGVAACRPGSGLTAEALLESADGAMYRAKHGGRNRVAC